VELYLHPPTLSWHGAQLKNELRVTRKEYGMKFVSSLFNDYVSTLGASSVRVRIQQGMGKERLGPIP
jgi:hypothetical protein